MLKIEIYQDNDYHPRVDDEVFIGKLITWHRNYDIGDQHNYANPYEFQEEMVKRYAPDTYQTLYNSDLDSDAFEKAIIDTFNNGLKGFYWLPVYFLDHGSISLSTGGFSDTWDSGRLGYIYTDDEELTRKLGYITPQDTIETYLDSTIEVENDYLNGNIYGIDVSKDRNCHTVGGFIGTDFEFSGLYEALEESIYEFVDNPTDAYIQSIVRTVKVYVDSNCTYECYLEYPEPHELPAV